MLFDTNCKEQLRLILSDPDGITIARIATHLPLTDLHNSVVQLYLVNAIFRVN